VLLFYMGDRSQAAIAQFLDITPNAVKTRLYSARRRLRASMSDIESNLGGARPSSDPRFAEMVRRLIQPEALKQRQPWMWSPGIGTDVWQMFCASMTGDLGEVKRLVASDPSLARCHYEYRTPLSFAVRNNQLPVAEFLLDHGALQAKLGDPFEMARDRGFTEMVELLERKLASLHGASAKGEVVATAIRDRDIGALRRLLDASPELVHAGDRKTNQPIHWGTMTRQLDMIDELLARGANIDAERFDAARPIHLTNGDYDFRGWRDVPRGATKPAEVYQHLLRRGAFVDVWTAAARGDVARVRELIDADPGVIHRNNPYNSYYDGSGSVLRNAAVGGHIEIVRLLLERGADPNLPQEQIAPYGGALYAAAGRGDYEMAKLLLAHGAYPNPPVESSADAVWIAIRDGNMRILKLLAEYGAVWDIPISLDGTLTYEDIVATGIRRPLKILAYYNDISSAAAALDAEPSLAEDSDALEAAASQGHEKLTRLLLRIRPETARRIIVSKPRAMAELLFEDGMDPNRPNWMRITPLHRFARGGDIESASVYLDHGADIEARDEEESSTPLGWAAEAGQLRMVEFLLGRGARAHPTNVPLWAAPISWARRRRHVAIVALLESYDRTGQLPRRTLADYDALAHDLVRSFAAGDDAALERIMEHFQARRALTWDRPSPSEVTRRLRRFVRERLERIGRRIGDVDQLDVGDTRQLIAQVEGFRDWNDLASRVK
jgi:ankyrin repeat protein